ncbi:YafY family transcriptional regulator [Luteimonas aestuarii]|uniref:YafY family transcriptional regulator n=1 Tax=Luteimonas aestuarii TaxID=453837 RepID=A0A4R5TXQ9_9GAMM|nr:YafY family protein [Luteimonas aestuarii]TDK25997.1 YafY family transcriptional regulator [Luteimonas aestuarii]
MLQTSSRLLRLLSLLQSRHEWSGAALAERLAITPRTVRRDVDRLRSLGYPVASSGGVSGGYRLAAGSNLPPLLLDDDEALAVSLGLRLATAGTVTGMEDSALRALAKLEQVMPLRLRKRVRNLHAAVELLDFGGPRIAHELLAALAGACRAFHCVQLRYVDKQGNATAREVEPHALVSAGSRWYLLAWDRMREEWRTFRVDRIDAMQETGTRFLPRKVPGGNAAAHVARALSIEPHVLKARIVLHAPLARMREKIPPSVGELQRIDATRCLLEVGAARPDAIAYHLALLGVDFEVREPPELAEEVGKLGKRLLAASHARKGAVDGQRRGRKARQL